MRLIRGLANLEALSGRPDSPLKDGCVATIGNFDGVHIGHQTIIQQVHDRAEAAGLPSLVMIFEPQPREFFQGDEAPPRLTGFRQKLQALKDQDVDVVLCVHFDERFRSYSAMGFIEDVLIEGLAVQHLVIGDDFRFGCDRAGDFALLQKVGADAGFGVERTVTVEVGDERVSSTRVRQCLQRNALDEAELLLGAPYAIEGRIVYGRQLGRDLDAPTANIVLRQRPALRGVFVVRATLQDGRVCDGVANIGVRPTVDGRQPSLEVHLFDFAGTLYGQRLRVEFRHPLRDEIKFDSVDALKDQIKQDFRDARDWLAAH